MTPGDLVDLTITGIAHGGVMIARHEGRVVFVADTLPGERVRAVVTEVTSSYARAATVDVLEASPYRRPHVWAEADVDRPVDQRPGGADLGHIDLAEQRQLKARVLRESLTRFASEREAELVGDVAAVGDDIARDGRHWRTRVSLHVHGSLVGPVAARSNRVVPVASHPLVHPDLIEHALTAVPGRGNRIELIRAGDGTIVRHDVTAQPRSQRRRRRGASAARGGEVGGARAGHDATPEPASVVDSAGGHEFRRSATGFWQVHRDAADTLYAAVAEAAVEIVADDATIGADVEHLDLYGGVGLLAHALSHGIGSDARVVSVEAARGAADYARTNLSALPRARAIEAPVERYLAEPTNSETGIVVLDPPRSGAGREVVERIADRSPRGIVYVACDPVALARDLATFAGAGYRAQSIRAFDLFPHSHHLEAVALIRPESSL